MGFLNRTACAPLDNDAATCASSRRSSSSSSVMTSMAEQDLLLQKVQSMSRRQRRSLSDDLQTPLQKTLNSKRRSSDTSRPRRSFSTNPENIVIPGIPKSVCFGSWPVFPGVGLHVRVCARMGHWLWCERARTSNVVHQRVLKSKPFPFWNLRCRLSCKLFINFQFTQFYFRLLIVVKTMTTASARVDGWRMSLFLPRRLNFGWFLSNKMLMWSRTFATRFSYRETSDCEHTNSLWRCSIPPPEGIGPPPAPDPHSSLIQTWKKGYEHGARIAMRPNEKILAIRLLLMLKTPTDVITDPLNTTQATFKCYMAQKEANFMTQYGATSKSSWPKSIS
jgi:hypothetical protein